MTKKVSQLFALSVALFVFVACQLFSPQKVQEVVQKTIPTVAQVATQVAQEATSVAPTQQPQQEPTLAPSVPELRTPSRDALRSYRVAIKMAWKGPFPTNPMVVWKMSSAWQKEPEPIFHMAVRQGNPLQLAMEVYQTSQGLYLRTGENQPWTFLPGTQYEEALAGQVDLEAFGFPTVWTMGVSAEGRPDTYRGMPVLAYHWETQAPEVLAALRPDTWTQDLGGSEVAGAKFEPHKIVADVKATKDGWVVYEEVHFEGQWILNGQTSPGEVDWVGEVTDINADFRIPLPKDLPQQTPGTVTAPLPLPDGAQVEVNSPPVLIVSLPGMTVQELLDYWTQNQGLKITSQLGDANAGGMMVMVQKPDGSTVQVMITAKDQGLEILFNASKP